MCPIPEAFDDDTLPRRFYRLKQVAAMLATTQAQVHALVRCGDLPAITLGGRGQWRVEGTELDKWIDAQYQKTKQLITEHPVGLGDPLEDIAEDYSEAGRVTRKALSPRVR